MREEREREKKRERDLQRVLFKSRPLAISRLPLKKIFHEFFVRWGREEAPPKGGHHLWARVVLRDRHHDVHQPHLLAASAGRKHSERGWRK